MNRNTLLKLFNIIQTNRYFLLFFLLLLISLFITSKEFPKTGGKFSLQLDTPNNGQIVGVNNVVIKGKTLPNTTLVAYTQHAISSFESDINGEFEDVITVNSGLNEVVVSAFSDSGKANSYAMNIVYDTFYQVKGDNASGEEQKGNDQAPGQEKKQEPAPEAPKNEPPKNDPPPQSQSSTQTSVQEAPKNEAPKKNEPQQQTQTVATPQTAIVGNVERVTTSSVVVEDTNKKKVETKVDRNTIIINDQNKKIDLQNIKPKDKAAIIIKDEYSDQTKLKNKLPYVTKGLKNEVKNAEKIYVKKDESSTQSKRKSTQGIIKQIQGNTVTISPQSKEDNVNHFIVDSSTVYKINDNEKAKLTDLQIGYSAAIVYDVQNQGLPVAKLFHVKSGKNIKTPNISSAISPISTAVSDFYVNYFKLVEYRIGNYLNFDYSVWGEGDTSQIGSVDVALWYDDKVFYQTFNVQSGDNKPGRRSWNHHSTFNKSKSIIVTPGLHTVKVCLDPYNKINENSETNNCKVMTFTATNYVSPAPTILSDFYVNYFNLVEYRLGNNLNYDYGLWGDGNTSQVGSVEVAFWYDNEVVYQLFNVQTGDNQPGRSWNHHGSFGTGKSIIITPGTHTIKICLDPNNKIKETNETNNCKQSTFTASEQLSVAPTKLSDFFVNYFKLTENSVGNNLQFDYGLWGDGDTSYIGSVETAFWYDNQVVYQTFNVQSGDNQPGRSWNHHGTFRSDKSIIITPGIHTIKICLDPNNKITEYEEGNNCKQHVFTAAEPNFPTPTIYGY